MVAPRGLITLLSVALAFQGFVGVIPHDHGTTCVAGPAFEAPERLESPHHCLACSVHAPTTVMSAGVAVVRSETGVVPVVAMVPNHGFSAPVESSGPRGPPRVI